MIVHEIRTTFSTLTLALSDEELGRLCRAMMVFEETGETLSLTGNEQVLWPVLLEQLTRRAEERTRLRANGRKGGRPRKAPAESAPASGHPSVSCPALASAKTFTVSSDHPASGRTLPEDAPALHAAVYPAGDPAALVHPLSASLTAAGAFDASSDHLMPGRTLPEDAPALHAAACRSGDPASPAHPVSASMIAAAAFDASSDHPMPGRTVPEGHAGLSAAAGHGTNPASGRHPSSAPAAETPAGSADHAVFIPTAETLFNPSWQPDAAESSGVSAAPPAVSGPRDPEPLPAAGNPGSAGKPDAVPAPDAAAAPDDVPRADPFVKPDVATPTPAFPARPSFPSARAGGSSFCLPLSALSVSGHEKEAAFPRPFPDGTAPAAHASASVPEPGAVPSADPLDDKVRAAFPDMTESQRRSFLEDRRRLGDGLIAYAVDRALAFGSRGWGYVARILRSYVSQGISTVEEARVADARWEAARRPARPPRPAAIRGPEREYTEQQLEEMLGVNDLFRN